MSRFLSTVAKRTEPYVPGEQLNQPDIIKLNTNENPYPPSPKVLAAIQEALDDNSLQRYPSPTADPLRHAIADTYGLTKEQVFVGNGSDEVLAFSFMAFFEPGQTIKFPEISYSFYPVYSKIFDIPFEKVPLNEDFTLPIEQFSHSDGGVILPNPNAPTSIYADLDMIEEILQQNRDQVVIIDEAYIDFAGPSAITLIDRYDNLLVIQTTSKSRALAGLRVGFALGQPELIAGLTRIKDSFNSYTVDRLAMAGATAAFQDHEYFLESTKKIIRTRERCVESLRELEFDVLPSDANFLFAKPANQDAQVLYEQLKDRGILVRHFDQAGINNYLRITIGTDEQMEVLMEALKQLIK
ncbi:histidinol-phosphate transaminase [Sporosarcina newyorkensis 2681]|uniref:Histidinol-phosphate aminotransferase n=1 Tax=Sporosarcina newyorkensis 2681 TaxID=1027292 RepID=F9DWG5_9BACL|nr:histidinol-phosphate transaminase [Sporosarcina newyorkensis]EGQ21786.1 histidinol-phosphate transaminase [Sporosarcina newyorkensis 2681]